MPLDLITNFFLSKILVTIIDVVAVFLAFVVYADNHKGTLNRIYVIMTVLMMSWVTFAYIPRVIDERYYNLGLIFLKIAWFVTPLFFVFLYLLSVNLVEKEKKYRNVSIGVVLIGIVLTIISGFTNLVVSGFQTIDGIVTIIYGNFKIPFLIGISLVIIATLIPLFSKKVIFHDKKMQFFSLGLFVFLFFNLIFNITLPMFLGIARFYFLGDYSTLILLALIAYAITSHQLFNVKVVVVEIISFFIWAGIFVQFLLAPSLDQRLLSGGLLFFVIIFGILLIRSVRKEVKLREQIEKLATDLRRSYELEKKALAVEKQAKEELQNLDKTKNQFLVLIQHNLRTPLTSMRGYTDLILNGTFGKQTKKTTEVIQKLQLSTENLIKMVNDFLDITQFQLGKDVILLKPGVPLEPILEEIVSDLKFNADRKGIYLKLEKPEIPLVIVADREKLKASLYNIIDNAIKYTPKGGVTVQMKNHGTAKIIISDTGIGMSAENLKTLFTRMFERAESAKKVAMTGSGIGLYLACQIIKSHRGKIWAESEGEGKGSVFHIELPMGETMASSQESQSQPTIIKNL